MRIDDDNSDRIKDARNADRKQQELQNKRHADEATRFDRKLQSNTQQQATQQKAALSQQQTAKSAIQSLLDAQKDTSIEGKLEGLEDHVDVEEVADEERHAESEADAQKLGRNNASRQDVDRKTGRVVAEGRGDDQHVNEAQGESAQAGGKELDARQVLRKTDTQADARQQEDRDDRKSPTPTNSSGRAADTADRVGEKQEKDSGGSGGQQQGKNGSPNAFRLPPAALMAPPPVAVPKGDGQVSRLRQVAQEIAEKIVKAARVGVNKMGLPEFQIELKSDILKGLKVKVSGRHGRIRATFSSRDLQVLKQLRGEVEGLRSALTARGLKVDALEIEEERA